MPAPTVLRQVALFEGLDGAELDLIASAARKLRFPKGSIVFQEGDPGDFLLVIEKGRVKVTLLGDDGREQIVNIMEAPAMLGEVALLDGSPRSATVMTIEATVFVQIARAPLF